MWLGSPSSARLVGQREHTEFSATFQPRSPLSAAEEVWERGEHRARPGRRQERHRQHAEEGAHRAATAPHPAPPAQPPALQLVEEFSTVLGPGSSRVSLQCKSRGVLPSPEPPPALAPWAGCPGVSTGHKKAATSDIYFLSPALLCLLLNYRKLISVSTFNQPCRARKVLYCRLTPVLGGSGAPRGRRVQVPPSWRWSDCPGSAWPGWRDAPCSGTLPCHFLVLWFVDTALGTGGPRRHGPPSFRLYDFPVGGRQKANTGVIFLLLHVLS